MSIQLFGVKNVGEFIRAITGREMIITAVIDPSGAVTAVPQTLLASGRVTNVGAVTSPKDGALMNIGVKFEGIKDGFELTDDRLATDERGARVYFERLFSEEEEGW